MSERSPEPCLAELHPESFGWALHCCGWDRQEAEDVLQTAYLKVLDGRARFDGRSSVKTWLFAVIRRTAVERRRGRWARSLLALRWQGGRPGPPPPATPEALAGDAERARELREALAGLPRRQRDVLHLIFYQDLTLEEAARVLGLSLGSVRTHYHRGKTALRRRLAGEGSR
jgi:RNA polymerase sigma factor (sigma-70 family)